MNEQQLKAAWQGAATSQQSTEALHNMLQEGKHPVLKRMRKQLLIELAGFSAFLVVYYDFFDGNRKPLYANLLLVAGVVLVLLHNLWGYLLTRKKLTAGNVTVTLQQHAHSLRNWAVTAVTCRIAAFVCILLFFTSVITLTQAKLWLLAGAVAVAVVQILLLALLWANRIKAIQSVINDFRHAA
ncbi:hypothetical protein HNQ91_004546 [Filimonas zeae]|uniref:Uncharacterized protein n=1 Tax=Filimonas zeae TaxID=1737353 RepID=A0A917MXJ2_9BACT|nr:hypothetical protein [Filimonas zeae]MDR6341473.1 hypothetical protein [Filimonas zeae]GGH75694.1 hypothetical protein GCM10011379_39520 [Filimonas zeae]